MFFSSVQCYDTQKRQEIRGLSINTVALLYLKIKKKRNSVGGGRKKEQGGRRPGQQIIKQQKQPCCWRVT